MQMLERGTVIAAMENGQGTQSERGRVVGNCFIILCILVLQMSIWWGEITSVDDGAPQVSFTEIIDSHLRFKWNIGYDLT
jgi:hypothetical protein